MCPATASSLWASRCTLQVGVALRSCGSRNLNPISKVNQAAPNGQDALLGTVRNSPAAQVQRNEGPYIFLQSDSHFGTSPDASIKRGVAKCRRAKMSPKSHRAPSTANGPCTGQLRTPLRPVRLIQHTLLAWFCRPPPPPPPPRDPRPSPTPLGRPAASNPSGVELQEGGQN